MKFRCGTIFAVMCAAGAMAADGASRLFTMDMVHHNPGDRPTESRFLDPTYLAEPEKVTRVVHLATGLEVPFSVTGKGIAIRLPETFRTNPYADGFVISVKREP